MKNNENIKLEGCICTPHYFQIITIMKNNDVDSSLFSLFLFFLIVYHYFWQFKLFSLLDYFHYCDYMIYVYLFVNRFKLNFIIVINCIACIKSHFLLAVVSDDKNLLYSWESKRLPAVTSCMVCMRAWSRQLYHLQCIPPAALQEQGSAQYAFLRLSSSDAAFAILIVQPLQWWDEGAQ